MRDCHSLGTNSSRKVQITNISLKNFPPLCAKTLLKNHLPESFDTGNINIIYRVEFQSFIILKYIKFSPLSNR